MRKVLGLLYLILIMTNCKPVNEDPTISLTNTGIYEDFRLDSIGEVSTECDNCHALYTSPFYNLAIRVMFGRKYADKWIYPIIAKVWAQDLNNLNKIEKKTTCESHKEIAYWTT